MPALNFRLSATFNKSLMIHPHWQEYSKDGRLPVSHLGYMTTGFVMLAVGVFGSFGNGLLIWIFSRTPSLRSPANAMIVNLAISDFGNTIVEIIMMVPSTFTERWLFQPTGCRFYGLMIGLFGFTSILTYTTIAIDRLCSVVKWNTWYPSYLRVSAMISIAWIFSLMLVIPPLFGISDYILESIQTSCTFDYLSRKTENIYYNIFIFALGFMLPLIIISICYTVIIVYIIRYRKLQGLLNATETKNLKKARETLTRKGSKVTFDMASTMTPAFMRETISCIIMILLYCIAWTPYAVIALVGIFGDQSLLTPLTTTLPGIFAKMSVIYNPMVHAFADRKFRRALRKLLTKTKKKKPRPNYQNLNPVLENDFRNKLQRELSVELLTNDNRLASQIFRPTTPSLSAWQNSLNDKLSSREREMHGRSARTFSEATQHFDRQKEAFDGIVGTPKTCVILNEEISVV